MEVDFQFESKLFSKSKRINYEVWQQSRVKWNLYLKNKHNQFEKQINVWDKIIIDKLLPGPTIAWDCGGLYLDGLINDLYVAETLICPRWISPNINIVDEKVDLEFRKLKAKNLISIQPNTIKYNHSIYDFLVRAGWSNQNWKPALLPYMDDECRIFLSFSDYMLYFNRFKYSVLEFINLQIAELLAQGFITEFCQIDEDKGKNTVNGNVKLILFRKK